MILSRKPDSSMHNIEFFQWFILLFMKKLFNAFRYLYLGCVLSVSAQDDFGGLGAGGALICDNTFRSGNWGCGDLAGSNSIGGSYPLLFDAFNINPSGLPVFSSPLGVELFYADSDLNVSLIKGQKGFGLGLTRKKTNMTYFSSVENYKVAVKNSAQNFEDATLDAITNLGFSLETFNIDKFLSLPFGLSFRYNENRKFWTPVLGTSLKFTNLNVGYSYYEEDPGTITDEFREVTGKTKAHNLGSGLKFGKILLDYSLTLREIDQQIKWTSSGGETNSMKYRVTTQIISAIYKFGDIEMVAGHRIQKDTRFDDNVKSLLEQQGVTYEDEHTLLGITYKTGRLSMGLHHNYVVGQDIAFLAQLMF
jgi:hypothetical protein